MTRIAIYVEVEEGADPSHSTGLTVETYERLTDPLQGPLSWLGEIDDVELVEGVGRKPYVGGGPKRPKPLTG